MKGQHDVKKWLQMIGANFHALRVTRKKEIKTVAKTVKISEALLERIEKGQYDMELELYAKLCAFYDVSLRDVLTENKFSSDTHK